MNNYCEEKGNKVLEFLDISNQEKWHKEKLIHEDEIPLIEYWKTQSENFLGVIDVQLDLVIGTNHIDYAGKTWLENLGCLKRFSNNYTREFSLSYLKSLNNDSSIHYSRFGDKYIISGDGNHRTHIAKFLGIKYIKAKVTEFSFDIDFYNLINEFRINGLKIKLNENKLFREASWTLNFRNTTIFIYDYKILKLLMHNYKTINIKQIEYKWICFHDKYFSKNEKKYYKLNSTLDFTPEFIILLKKIKTFNRNQK